MFKQRFLTALVLIPLVLVGIFYANDAFLAGVVTTLVLALAWEWVALIPLSRLSTKIGFFAGLIGVIGGMFWLLPISLLVDGLLWCGILIALVTYPKSTAVWGKSWLVMGLAWFLLALFANSIWALLHVSQGRGLLVYLLCLVWATDIGAYAAGKLWGKHRLIPNVSPGKTIEGTSGGAVLALLVAGLGAFYFQPQQLMFWFCKALVIIGLAMIGDLFISMLKRRCQVKDTGHILPGHGGILDRLDSLIAAVPFFYYFYQSMI
ncbi:MAG: phosphatidate cytidylyltransferase [Gammaproteobacteria bacterium]|nr:phosphatidate cytidylyltransferase [Gammaproteobacteria bacterium]